MVETVKTANVLSDLGSIYPASGSICSCFHGKSVNTVNTLSDLGSIMPYLYGETVPTLKISRHSEGGRVL